MAKYRLSAGALVVLRSVIQFQGSAKTLDEIWRAGHLLVVQLPDPKPATDEAREVMLDVEMDGPDRDFCKAALQHALGKEILPNSKFSYELVVALDLVTVPKAPAAT
jgi:hypothetical protein